MVYTSNTSTDNLNQQIQKMILIVHYHGLRPPSGLQLVEAGISRLSVFFSFSFVWYISACDPFVFGHFCYGIF